MTKEENFNPSPVSVIMPIMIPAQAHAVATGITASTPFSIVLKILDGVNHDDLRK